MLAQEKALAAARGLPGRIVIGADQVLALDGVRFSKPADRASARSQLQVLRGRTHVLLSAVAVVRDAEVRFAELATARLTMREFSDSFLDAYLDAAGRTVEESVGGYQLEGLGIHLFEHVDGEHSTILGLPLLPLLDFLRREGLLTG
jgi:septum formation protein